MIVLLMRGDRLWRFAMPFAVVSVILLLLIPASIDPGTMLQADAFGFLGVLVGGWRHRAALFEIALPIPRRQIFLARLLPLLTMVWLPSAGSLAAIAIRWGPSSPLFPAVLRFAVIATFAAVLSMSVRVTEASPPAWLSVALCAGVAGAGRAAWDLLSTAAIMLLFGVAAAALFLKTWSATPQSFQVAPRKATRGAVFPALPGVLPLAWRPVLRCARPWPALVNLFLMAIFVSTVFWFYCFAFFGIQMHTQARKNLRWLSALALSYRKLLLITLAASVGPLVAGAVVGTCLSPMGVEPAWIGHLVPPAFIESYGPDAPLPLEFWRRAPGGQAPAIRAPWGETARPLTISILGISFYNPYSAYRSSHRFVEWQWLQASRDYDLGRMPLSQNWPAGRRITAPAVTDIRFRLLCLSALLVGALCVAFVGELSRWHRLRRPSATVRRILLCGLAGLPMVAMLAVDALCQHRYATPVAIPLIKAALLNAMRLLPNSVPLVAAIAAVPVLGMYGLLERQFRQSELLGPLVRPEGS